MPENPRAVAGDNLPAAYAQRVVEALERDYKALTDNIAALLDKAREAPRSVESDEVALAVGAVIKELRDADKRAEAFRQTEKEPYLRSEQAVDQFFFALRDKLAKRSRQNRSGAIDVLQDRVNAYLERKRALEEAERHRIAQEEARKAAEKAAEEAKLRQEAEDARAREERARKPENVAAHAAVAEKAERDAAQAAAEAVAAADRAQEAHIATLAKPADMARTRGDDGVLLTQSREAYVIITDRTKLDWTKIAPFFTDAEVEKAVRGWARVTGHNQPMDGAEIGYRRKGVTR